MRLAIMQPYCFPYVGYFQLVGAVDRFVFFDDVDFIKRGWINRNRVLVDGKVHTFSIPVQHVTLGTKINEVRVAPAPEYLKSKLLPTLKRAYAKADNFGDAFPMVRDIIEGAGPDIASLAKRSIRGVAGYLGLAVDFVDSSTVYGNQSLRGQDRILDICVREGATEYHNPPGGKDLYDESAFASKGIALRFVQPDLHPYRQAGAVAFEPGLSILDAILNLPRSEARALVLGCRADRHSESLRLAAPTAAT